MTPSSRGLASSGTRARVGPLALLLLVLAWIAAPAAATAGPRLALVDGASAPQLHEALQISLAPWSIEVVDWPSGHAPVAGQPPPSIDGAGIASRANARYVVWIEAGELVVLDAALDRREARPLDAVPQDEADASAVALSVKTALRLPPALAVRAERSRWRVLPSVRLGGRVALDGDGGSGLRAQAALEIQPPGWFGVRLGVVGELGSALTLSRASFKGEWSEWNAQLQITRDFPVKAWTLGVALGVGVSRAVLTGEEMRVSKSESHVGVVGGASASLGRPLGPVVLGLLASLSARGATQYVRDNGMALWQEPSVLGALMGVVALPL